MASIVNLKAIGLNTQPNSLDVAEGSLIEASNVIIERNNVIEPRRGFKLFGSSFGTSTDRLKQMTEYRSRILRHYNNILQFQSGTDQNGEMVFTDFSYPVTEVDEGLRIKFIESNGNSYFTTSEGIKKISATSGSTISSGMITSAGGLKALDAEASLVVTLGSQSGFLPQDSAIAYRILWGKTDANNNLINGTPSQRVVIYNPLLGLLIPDYLNVLGSLDNISNSPSMINDGNYVETLKLPLSSTASEVLTSLQSLSTKLDRDILYADNNGSLGVSIPFEIDTVTISAGACTVQFINVLPGAKVNDYFSVGNKVYIEGTFTCTSGSVSGLQTLTEVDGTLNTISFSTLATGTVSIDSTSKIESGTFRSITIPTEPSSPATNDELVALQTYLDNIIQGLQSLSISSIIASDSGVGLNLNIDGTSCSVTAGVATITFSSGDPRDLLQIGSYISLSGMTPTSGTFASSNAITNLTATTLQFSTTAGDGSITVGSDATISKIIHFTEQQATDFIDSLDITTTATVNLEITVPREATTADFYQVYRSNVTQATGTTVLADLSPNDEMQLVYENYPTTAELDSGFINVSDITPDDFKGANLYTNSTTGEGITQANDIPPFASDVNRFRNTIFYANTKTRHRKIISLLGISNMLDDYNNSIIPSLTIASDSITHTYTFVKGATQITQITCGAFSDITSSGYFLLNSAYDKTEYYVWFDKTGTDTDPLVANKTGIKVDVTGLVTSTQIAEKLSNILTLTVRDFTVSALSSVVTVQNTEDGQATQASIVTGLAGAFAINTTQNGVGELAKQEVSKLICGAGNTLTNAGVSDYLLLNTAFNYDLYYVWLNVDDNTTDPAINGRSGVEIPVLSTDTASQIALKIATGIQTLFDVTVDTNTLYIKSIQYGPSNGLNIGTLPGSFTDSTEQEGILRVILSSSISPAIAVEETAKSLLRVINQNKSEQVYGYYLSSVLDVPGKFILEQQDIFGDKFYVLANNNSTGDSFNPILTPSEDTSGNEIELSNSSADPTLVTSSSVHGLTTGDSIVINNSNSVPSLSGIHTVTVVSPTTFTIDVHVITPGTEGVFKKTSSAESSDNEIKQNRVYYSKFQQPEAVPITNYFDVGAEDKPILRIFPLRDSLFVFKTDGLYRISGESAPFNLTLFDSSVLLKAPDSVAVLTNQVYCYTTQGIIVLSEAGSNAISLPIDSQIRNLSASQYTNFNKLTFGVGYESDDSYYVWTNTNTTDEVATVCYRYSTRTTSWTTLDKTNTCGINFTSNDKMYLGAGDTNYMEQERKNFDRYDYADREIISNLSSGAFFGNKIKLPTITGLSVGDVLVQNQSLTVYDFNMLLKKIDLDSGLTDNDYFLNLQAQSGDNMRNALVSLAVKLDNDVNVIQNNYFSSISTKSGAITNNTMASTTVITSASHGLATGRVVAITGSNSVPSINGIYPITVVDSNTFTIPVSVTAGGTSGAFITQDNDFQDLKTCMNIVINKINADAGINFNNYQLINHDTVQEAIITQVNKNAKEVTLNLNLEFVVGELVIFKSIKSKFTYAPLTMGDPLGLKQVREATVMYSNKNFTQATLTFYTDLIQQLASVPVNGMGNGIFGHSAFGSGLFGGLANSTPTRTYIPRQHQRCRFIVMGFEHQVAREKYEIYGSTLTGRVGISSRAYR